jgi:hypothetical protein
MQGHLSFTCIEEACRGDAIGNVIPGEDSHDAGR